MSRGSEEAAQPKPQVVRATVERVLDDGAKGTSWKAIVVRAVAPEEPETARHVAVKRPSKDKLERMVVTLKEPPAAKAGHELMLFGTVSPSPDGSLPRFRNAMPGGDLAMTYRAMPGRTAPPDLAALVSDQLRASGSANAVSVLRAESHPDPAVADAMRLMSDPSVEMYRPQAVLVADMAAIRSAEDPMRRVLSRSLPSGMIEDARREFAEYADAGSAAVFGLDGAEGWGSGNVVLPTSDLSPSMTSLTQISMVFDGSLTPRAGVDVRVDAKYTALHELAHSHQAGFGIEASDGGVRQRDFRRRRGECFADGVAVAAMVLDGEDPKQVERIVMAREVSGIMGPGTHVAGLGARRAFDWAMEHVRRHGVSRDEARRVPMHRIMTMAARFAEESAIRSTGDLIIAREAVLTRAGSIGRESAEATAAHVRQAVADLRADPVGIEEPEKLFATMESAASAIERSMWTAHDLSDPKRAAQHAETVRKDLFATLSDLNRKGLPRAVIDQVIERERKRAGIAHANAVDGVRERAERRGGMEGLVHRYVNAYLAGDTLAPIKEMLGRQPAGGPSVEQRASRRWSEFVGRSGFGGRVADAVSALRAVRLLDPAFDRDLNLARTSAHVVYMAVAAAEQAAGKLPDAPPPAGQKDAFVALRSENLVTPRNPWHHGLDKRLEMAGRLSQQAATIALLAERDPARAGMLQERFDYLMSRRAQVLLSLTALEETRTTLEKRFKADDPGAGSRIDEAVRNMEGNLEGMPAELREEVLRNFRNRLSEQSDAGVRLVRSLQGQAQWDVTAGENQLPLRLEARLDALIETAERLGHKVVMPETSPKPEAAVAAPKRDSRGFVILRNAEGRPHCADDWAVMGPNGERHAFVNGQRAFVVRMETPDGERMTSRLMSERDATTLANAYGGLVRKPTEEDFQVIRREARNDVDFLPIMPEPPVRRAINL